MDQYKMMENKRNGGGKEKQTLVKRAAKALMPKVSNELQLIELFAFTVTVSTQHARRRCEQQRIDTGFEQFDGGRSPRSTWSAPSLSGSFPHSHHHRDPLLLLFPLHFERAQPTSLQWQNHETREFL